MEGGVDGVNKIWRDAKLRGVGMKRATKLVDAAGHSIGSREGLTTARMEIKNLLSDYERYSKRMEEVVELIDELVKEIPYVEKMLQIKGVGIKTISGLVAEIGDIRRFDNPKQIQKLAGYALVEDSSGKHQGETRISRRGRKKLRYLLFEASLSLVGKNEEFKELHYYYTHREENPLKKKQSLVAVAMRETKDQIDRKEYGMFGGKKKLKDEIVQLERQEKTARSLENRLLKKLNGDSVDEVIKKFNRMRMEMDAYKNFVDRAEDAKEMLDENVREYMKNVQEKALAEDKSKDRRGEEKMEFRR